MVKPSRAFQRGFEKLGWAGNRYQPDRVPRARPLRAAQLTTSKYFVTRRRSRAGMNIQCERAVFPGVIGQHML